MVEFAIAAPVTLLVILGLIAGSLLAYQNVAISDGASAGARMATIETSLDRQQGPGPVYEYCESGSPESIEAAVAAAMPQVPVDNASLCASSTSATTLTQTPQSGRASVTVVASPSIGDPQSVTVTVSVVETGIAVGFQGSHAMSASSTLKILQP
jgi:Flp pilus assembly protein TadG